MSKQQTPEQEPQATTTQSQKPSRRRGRPLTGNAKSRAEIQANYRLRKASESITVTFQRDDLSALKTILANVPDTLGLPEDVIDRLARRVFDAALK